MTEHNPSAPSAESQEPQPTPVAPRPGKWHLTLGVAVLLVACLGLTGWVVWNQGETALGASSAEGAGTQNVSLDGSSQAIAPSVEVVTPQRGGIQRICLQPGTVEPFESADLYAKVSGFLAEQNVDIGSRVKAGELLAKISVPELEKQVARDEATLDHEKAKVAQAEAQLTAAQAKAKAAKVSIALAETVYKAKSSYRKYREKQLARLTQLNDQHAIEPKVVDESQDYFEASLEGEAAAKEAIAQAQEQAAAAEAEVALARANVKESEAAVAVAVAELEKSRVFLGYTEIRSPYDGVVTRRTFYRGEFIRAADLGGLPQPILSVERTDKMRVVIHVPDRDVPYVTVGDKAEMEIDALPGLVLEGVVARKADSEDSDTRTMRTEVDLVNTKGLLCRGMYGQARLQLDAGPAAALTIPSSALIGKKDDRHAEVRIVDNGKLRTVPIEIGADNGVAVEVRSGLGASQLVVVRTDGAVENGSPVTVVQSAHGAQ